MKAKHSPYFFVLILWSNLYSQDTSWKKVRIDENLTVAIPENAQQVDTAFSKGNDTIGFKIFKAETKVSTIGVTVTPNGTGINVDDEESLHTALNGIEQGTYARAKEKGFTCKSKDTVLDNLPCKKFEFFSALVEGPVIYNYTFLVNGKMYMFTIAPLRFREARAELVNESKLFLNSIRFTKTVEEKKFATKAESTAYKFGYYLVPFLLIIGFIAYIVIRIVKS